MNLESMLAAACEAARRAGKVLLEHRKSFGVREKGRFDLVTDADLAAQETVQTYLGERFPNIALLGEEHAPLPTARKPGQAAWVVDPLDGTTNYVHDFPFYAVSIGLEAEGEPVLGVIHDPNRDELFHAGRGLGAFLNGSRIAVSAARELGEALISTGFPPDMHGMDHIQEVWKRFSQVTRSLRRTGSTALNLAYVACGRNDGFYTHQAHPWDACAGVCLIREAGGSVSNLDGSPYNLFTLDILASNGKVHDEMVRQLVSCVA
jgi:myo-inositol-1(or 4)-monophosphatase